MRTGATATIIEDARAVGWAADTLARAVRRDTDVDMARRLLQDRAEAVRSTSTPSVGPRTTESAEVVLAECLSQLSIGRTLLAADSALASPGTPSEALRSAVASLEDTTTTLEVEAAPPPRPHRFDTRPGGVTLDVPAAARAALDEMSEAAATAATALLDRARKPLVSQVPDAVVDLVEDLVPSGGQLAQWGLRSVRKGLELLRTLIDLPTIAELRSEIDDVLGRLGRGEDTTVLLGWAIGARSVRDAVASPDAPARRDDGLVAELAAVTARYQRVCRLLRQIAGAIVAAAAALALAQVVTPAVAALSGLALVAVLGALVILGRDHTGATDLPGRTPGVLRLVSPTPHARP